MIISHARYYAETICKKYDVRPDWKVMSSLNDDDYKTTGDVAKVVLPPDIYEIWYRDQVKWHDDLKAKYD